MYSLLSISAFLAFWALFAGCVQGEVPPCSVVTEYATATVTVDGDAAAAPPQGTAAALDISSAPPSASYDCSSIEGTVAAAPGSTSSASQATAIESSNPKQSESSTVLPLATSASPPSTSTSTPPANNANLTQTNLRDPNDAFSPSAGIERINRCPSTLHYYPVWAHHISSPLSPSRPLLPNHLHFEPYHLSDHPHSPGSVSEKYASHPFTHLRGDTPIVQVEYTVSRAQPDRISADLSTIDCGQAGERGRLGACPVREGGYLLKFGKQGCRAARCVGDTDGRRGCEGAYNVPSDDVRAMRTCLVGEQRESWVERWNLTVVFCPDQGDLEGVVL